MAKPSKRALARHSPLGFAQWVWPKPKDGKKRFWFKSYPTARIVNAALLDLHNPKSETRTLVVTQPPRTGKSALCSNAHPAWYKGKYPDNSILVTGYSANLTAKFTLAARNFCQAHARDLWGLEISRDMRKKDDWAFEGTEGHCYSASIMGQITGQGFEAIVVDDPYANYEQAHSSTMREKVHEEMGSTIETRLQGDNPVILIIATRWHRDDVPGRAIQLMESGDRSVKHVHLPAIAEEDMFLPTGELLAEQGAPLFPWQWSLKRLDAWKRKYGKYMFEALFQGNPTTPSGTFWEEMLFRQNRFTDWIPTDFLVVSIDPAHSEDIQKGCDTAIVATGTNTGEEYLVDAMLERAGPIKTVDNLEVFIKTLHRPPDAIVIENNAMQIEMSHRMESMLKKNSWACEVFGLDISRDMGPEIGIVRNKHAKIQSIDPYIRDNLLKFKSMSKGANKLLEQCKAYGADKTQMVDGLDGLEIGLEFFSLIAKGQVKLACQK